MKENYPTHTPDKAGAPYYQKVVMSTPIMRIKEIPSLVIAHLICTKKFKNDRRTISTG